ncbi:hypothetical protein VDG1235_2235 [Verrucomicrobiia bacterium DG1235]|nr:hypothetical protein VDG1235_2235 [Verrucomicrobiae bacterium DG1235]
MIPLLQSVNASNNSIHCEVNSPNTQLAKDLSNIAKSCAIDLKLALPIRTTEKTVSGKRSSSITLTFPFEIAVSSDTVWKLASRIACFCPQAKVTAQIEANTPSKY